MSSLPAFSRWNTGKILAFSHLDGPTSYDHGLVARTVEGGIDIQLPGLCQLRFELEIKEAQITSDLCEIRGCNGMSLRGVLLDAYHLLIEGPCLCLTASATITTLACEGRLLVGSTSHFDPSLIGADFHKAVETRSRWLETIALPSTVNALSKTSKATLKRALAQMKGQVCSPEGLIKRPWTTPDRWPHRAMWLWDSAYHAIGWRHIDSALAQTMIDAVFDVQNSAGFIPHMTGPKEHSNITQPPILALAARLVFEKSGDLAWVARIYPNLCSYVNWDATHRDTDGGGLLEWQIEEKPDCRSGESGMDNSPRFDSAIPLDAPDFNAFLASEYEVLADFAHRLGLSHDAAQWSARHSELCGLINEKLWSEEHQLYCDRDAHSNTLSPVLSSAGFLPLLCGAPSERQARALAAHLENPESFGTKLPIPSIAVCDIEHYSKDMWRGPVWVNINWLVARGLKRYGLHSAAERLRALTLRELERLASTYGTFFEYIDDRGEVEPHLLLRKLKNIPGEHPHQAIHDYGWTATLYVDWLLAD